MSGECNICGHDGCVEDNHNTKYKSAWYSPRGFANEGTYIYGTEADVDGFFKNHVASIAGCGYGLTKNHRELRTAKERCIKDANHDKNQHHRCAEISNIDISEVSDMEIKI